MEFAYFNFQWNAQQYYPVQLEDPSGSCINTNEQTEQQNVFSMIS